LALGVTHSSAYFEDSGGQALAYVYFFEDEPGRRAARQS
jgi:hypothetical protein